MVADKNAAMTLKAVPLKDNKNININTKKTNK